MEHHPDASTKNQQLRSQYSIYKNLIAGGVAGAISRTVVSPLERAKILFQVQNSGSPAQITSNDKRFDSLMSTFRAILKNEGVLGLFKGNGTNILRIIPYSSMQFACYELFLKIFKKAKVDKPRTRDRLAAGACAGIAAATFTYPLDLVRTRLSLATSNASKTVIGCLGDVIRNEGGFFALYRGLWPTLMGIAPLVAINFAVYEKLKQKALDISGTTVSVPIRLFCGGTAGAVAQTVTYPLDVMRRRLQSSGLLKFQYSGVVDCFLRMIREEGIRSFYRGIVPNYLKVVPAVSVSFVTYETVQSLLL